MSISSETSINPCVAAAGITIFPGPIRSLLLTRNKPTGIKKDKGGNYLRYGKTHFNEQHAFWDDNLVERVAHGPDFRKLAKVLKTRVNLEGWTTTVDYHQWAEAWASDSVHEARPAYEGIVFESAELAKNGKLKLIQVQLPEDYERSPVNRAANQMGVSTKTAHGKEPPKLLVGVFRPSTKL